MICNDDCMTCSIPLVATHCLTCFSGEGLVKAASGNAYGRCEDCHDSCLTCTMGNDASKCQTCVSGLAIVAGATAGVGTCPICHSTCITCA